MITLNFLVTALIVVLMPGTGVIYTISTGLSFGRRASIIAALGCTAGIAPHLVATILGLSGQSLTWRELMCFLECQPRWYLCHL